MQSRTIILFVVLLGTIIVGMFTFAYLKRSELTAVVPALPDTSNATSATPYIQRVDAKHYFINGLHTFAGVIDMPTPCHLLTSEAVVRESFPEQIVINFADINNAEVCAQVITEQRFKVSVAASKDATITATWEGLPIEINLIPAAKDERPEEFELFIKG